jgi:hypothetical protein
MNLLRADRDTVAYLLNARIVESQWLAFTGYWPINNNRGMVFLWAVNADGYSRNSGICQAIAKQQLQCNRGMVFSVKSILGLYNGLNSVLTFKPVWRQDKIPTCKS